MLTLCLIYKHFKRTRSAQGTASAARGFDVCEVEHSGLKRLLVQSSRMERLLLLWDELDDLTGAARHLVANAANSLGALSPAVISAASALAIWFVAPQVHVNAAFLGLTAAFWGTYRSGVRISR
jgi:hypothetical protein